MGMSESRALETMAGFFSDPEAALTKDVLKAYYVLWNPSMLNNHPLDEGRLAMSAASLQAAAEVLGPLESPQALLLSKRDLAMARKSLVLHRLNGRLLQRAPGLAELMKLSQENVGQINLVVLQDLERPLLEAQRQHLSEERARALMAHTPWLPSIGNSPPPVKTLADVPHFLETYRLVAPGQRLPFNRALEAAGVQLDPAYRTFNDHLPPLRSLAITNPGMIRDLQDIIQDGNLLKLFAIWDVHLWISLQLPDLRIAIHNPAQSMLPLATFYWGNPRRDPYKLQRHPPDELRLASMLQISVIEQRALGRLDQLLPGMKKLLEQSSLRAGLNASEEAYLWLLALGYDADFESMDFQPADEQRLMRSFRREVRTDPAHFPVAENPNKGVTGNLDRAIAKAWSAYRQAAAILRQRKLELRPSQPGKAQTARLAGALFRHEIFNLIQTPQPQGTLLSSQDQAPTAP